MWTCRQLINRENLFHSLQGGGVNPSGNTPPPQDTISHFLWGKSDFYPWIISKALDCIHLLQWGEGGAGGGGCPLTIGRPQKMLIPPPHSE